MDFCYLSFSLDLIRMMIRREADQGEASAGRPAVGNRHVLYLLLAREFVLNERSRDGIEGPADATEGRRGALRQRL